MIKVGNCIDLMSELPDNSIDSIVTDPPYELGFMGKSWDSTGIAYNVEVWRQCLRILKPGGHLLAFGGSRTYHRLACAIEDAGFQIRDQIMWVYGSGFPKSLNIGKAIDKAAGAEREVIGKSAYSQPAKSGHHGGLTGDNINFNGERYTPSVTAPATDEAKQWEGWGTALKPAHEPIVMARKPLDGTVANNVLIYGVGGINIDGCRVAYLKGEVDFNRVQRQQADGSGNTITNAFGASALVGKEISTYKENGRFPANFIHDGSDEVLELFPRAKGGAYPAKRGQAVNTSFASGQETEGGFRAMGDDGSAARFFYCAKASSAERNTGLGDSPRKKSDTRSDVAAGIWTKMNAAHQNHHPTVKPVTLMRYLVRLVTQAGGTVLDPFLGSGTTAVAAIHENINWVGFEMNPEYASIAEQRVEHASF